MKEERKRRNLHVDVGERFVTDQALDGVVLLVQDIVLLQAVLPDLLLALLLLLFLLLLNLIVGLLPSIQLNRLPLSQQQLLVWSDVPDLRELPSGKVQEIKITSLMPTGRVLSLFVLSSLKGFLTV